jgi:hypothetical protein
MTSMADIQKIQWRRIGVESAAIVASILFAFAIDAAWDERQERTEEEEIILGLEQEFFNGRALLEQNTEHYENLLLGIEALLVASANKAWSSEEISIDTAIQALIWPSTIDFGSGILDAVISAGRLEIISNKALRGKLAGWKAVLDEVLDDEALNKDYIFNQLMPYLVHAGVSTAHGSKENYGHWPVATTSIADDPALMSQLLSDAKFEALLVIRYDLLYHTVQEIDAASQAVDEILLEISSTNSTDKP